MQNCFFASSRSFEDHVFRIRGYYYDGDDNNADDDDGDTNKGDLL